MNKIKTLLLVVLPLSLSAQFQVKQAITVAGGNFGQPGNYVKYGKYDYFDHSFQFFDSIPGDFTNAAVADGQILFSNASNTIYKHDLSVYTRLDSVPFAGTQTMELVYSYLIVGPSTVLNANSNKPMVFDRFTLDTIGEIDGFNYPIMDMIQIEDSLYIAWNISSVIDQVPPFGVYADSIGFISVVSLNNLTKVRDINLGNVGAGINSLAYDKVNRTLFGANSSNSQITKYNYWTGNLSLIPTNSINAKDLLGVFGDKLYGTFGSDGIGTWSISGDSIIQENVQTGAFVQAILDTVNEVLYATESDYFSYGNLNVFSPFNTPETFSCGISPEAIALDYYVLVGQDEQAEESTKAFPNPCTNRLEVPSALWVEVYNQFGQRVGYQAGSTIDVSDLAGGMYWVITNLGKTKVIKI